MRLSYRAVCAIGLLTVITITFQSIVLAAPRTPRRPTAQQSAPKSSSTDLRAQWGIGDLKLRRQAVDDGNFPADIKQSAVSAVDWFLDQQESLIASVDKNPKSEASAQKSRAALEQQFNQKMQVITSNPQFLAEMNTRLKALDKEMDEMAASADKIFASLDAAGVTPQQKAKLQPVIKQANAKLKAVAAKSASRSVKDKKVRDEAATAFRAVHAQLKQNLTPAQRDKLSKKLAADKDKENGR